MVYRGNKTVCYASVSPPSPQTYIVPDISLFGPVVGDPDALFNNIRVYGTILLILMAVVVFVGVKIVSACMDLHLAFVGATVYIRNIRQASI